MKRAIVVSSFLGLAAIGLFVARMSNSVHVLAQQTAYSQTTSNQYGTYTNSVLFDYDPLGGSGDGEVYITEQLTGRPSSFMPGGVLHTPHATVHFNGKCDIGNCTQTGNGVPANQSPNFSRTWSFDILGDCDQQFLDFGFCVGDGENGDFCPIAGALFINFLHGMEFEIAITSFKVPAHVRAGTATCTPQSSPADWPGLFESPDISDLDRTYRAKTGVIRFCANPPCTGNLWVATGKVKAFKIIDPLPVLDCTNKDKGFITDKNVTY